MQLRLRSLVSPFARLGVFLLRKSGASPMAVDTTFYLALILASGVFIWLSSMPFSQNLLMASVVLVFVSGFLEEVRREHGNKDSEVSRHADLILYGAILYYLTQESYINFYLSQEGHIVLGGALVLGIFLLEKVLERTVKGERSPGLEVPAERLLFLTLFAVTGYNHKAYEDFLLAGLALLTLLFYASSLYHYVSFKGFSISPRRARSIIFSVLTFYQDSMEKMKFVAGVVYRVLRQILETQTLPEKKPEGEAVPQGEGHGYNFTVMVVNEYEYPVPDAKVVVSSREGSLTKTGYTDTQGKCVFDGLREGQYTIAIEGEGLPQERYERYINMDSGEIFRLQAMPIDLSVVVNDGKEMRPIMNAQVTIETADGKTHERKTDNLGVAYFESLPGGYAELRVEARGYQEKTRRIDPAAEKVVSLNMRRRQLVNIHGSLLVEYRELRDAEEAVKRIIEAYTEQGERVCLVSTSSLLRECASPGIEVVDFSSALLEDIEIVLGELSSGGVLLFEPVTELIHRIGLDEALRFMAKLLSFSRDRKVSLVALINQGAHGERIAGMFEKLFEEVAEFNEGRMVEKGGAS
jgi:uncharacterized GH25 family protein